ncbi:MAG: histidine phosphatase family protein [Anaerolineales bacterium]|nr:histidine phosphatase family protein [Anaerolineales bacterium]
MQLYLLRHAQSVNNAQWDASPGFQYRYSDIPLTDLGRQQARATAEYLAQTRPASPVNVYNTDNRKGFGFTHIYCSLMLRATETAHLIAERLDMPIYGRTDLHEWGGVYEVEPESGTRTGLPGPDAAYFAEHFPRVILPADFNPAGWWNRPHEPQTDVPARARRVLKFIRKQHLGTDDRVLIVTHGGFINLFLDTLLGVTPKRAIKNLANEQWFVTNNTALARIDMGENFTGLIYLNRTVHLSDDLLT